MTQLQTPNRQQRPSRPCASTGGLSGGVPGGAPAGTSAAEAAASVPLVPTNNNHPGTANHNCPGPPVPKMSKGKETLFCSIQETAVSIKQSFITWTALSARAESGEDRSVACFEENSTLNTKDVFYLVVKMYGSFQRSYQTWA